MDENDVIDIGDNSSNDDAYDFSRLDESTEEDDDDDRYDVSRLNELTEEDVYKMKFDLLEDGERFYNAYAKVKGFSVRKDNIHTDNEGKVTSRKWVCSKEGYRQDKHMKREERIREPTALTRVGCLALFHLKLERKSSKYVVANFVSFHNHPLIGPRGVPFLRSHRKVRSPDKASANTMHKVGIGTSHIMDFAAQQSGGYDKVGYTQKDLYNHFTAQRQTKVVDGDAEGALAYLCAKAISDPLFYYKYDVDEENRLNNMFWRDSTSLTDYMCFGDVLLFDATYRTNAYGKPLVVLAGVNSHFKTTIFGCALLTAETVEAYTWVLEMFFDSMGNDKKPVSVLTDGDKAMRRAIQTVLPNASHRLCKWHLKKNDVSNVHVPGFLDEFEKCMSMPTVEEFEVAWTNLMDNYGLHENNWAIEVYNKRFQWARRTCEGFFFVGAKSTQRVEGMNAFLNQFLKLHLRLFEFVQAYDRALARLRHSEAKEQVESENSTPVLSTAMKRIEKHAADTFTRAIFYKFRKEIQKEQSLFLVDKVVIDDLRVYYLSRYQQPDATWSVNFEPVDGKMKCSCLKFESDWITMLSYDIGNENGTLERNSLLSDLRKVDKNGQVLLSRWQHAHAGMGDANDKVWGIIKRMCRNVLLCFALNQWI